jgi:large subunit ribosomal protein L6
MSRIGKQPVNIPNGVDVKIEEQKITVKGPKGELVFSFRPEVNVKIEDKQIVVSIKEDTKESRAFWGLTRSLIFNAVKGVTEGYKKELEIRGVGYKARIEGDVLVMEMGFSHLVNIDKPEGIELAVTKNIITISGIDKQLVGETSAQIRAVRPPEPYKGKGIRYLGEEVLRKVGKRAAEGTA